MCVVTAGGVGGLLELCWSFGPGLCCILILFLQDRARLADACVDLMARADSLLCA